MGKNFIRVCMLTLPWTNLIILVSVHILGLGYTND